MPRLIVLPLLVTAAACTASPAPRDVEPATEAASPVPVQASAQAAAEPSGQDLVAAMTERCRATVAGQPNASVPAVTRAAQMRDDWVQVDGIVEWGDPDDVARHAWTCDMFRDEAGVWHRRYLSYGPVT
ncbi:MAG TPA: hypothetical protein VLK84_28370 [Longimicrobium sp.]|nr:hypothetical protein [Longimicrobium sp.]